MSATATPKHNLSSSINNLSNSHNNRINLSNIITRSLPRPRACLPLPLLLLVRPRRR